MRLVISDTSPLHYLLLIDVVDILPKLYSHILIPQAVLEELSHAETPDSVRRWLGQPPPWLEVRSVSMPPDPSSVRRNAE